MTTSTPTPKPTDKRLRAMWTLAFTTAAQGRSNYVPAAVDWQEVFALYDQGIDPTVAAETLYP